MISLREPLRFWIMIGWIGVLALFGGASRPDEPAQLLVRVAAIAVIVASLWSVDVTRIRRARPLLIFAGIAVLTIAVQLVPLPPGLWAALPGRAFYAAIAEQAGVSGYWRPISLTPDLTINALFATLPALATLIAAVAMPHTDRHQLAKAFVVVAILSATLGLVQLTGASVTAYRIYSAGSPIGFFANRNHSSVFLATAIALLAIAGPAASAVRKPATWRASGPVIAGAIAMFLFVSILVVGSRAGLLVGFVALAALLMLSYGRSGNGAATRARHWRLLVPIAVLPVAALLALWLPRGLSVERLFASGGSDEIRITRLETLWQMVESFFPVGAGYGSFVRVFPRFEPLDQLDPSYANLAHNDPLQIVIEGGAVGAILAVVFVGWWLARAVPVWRPDAARSESRVVARTGWVVILIGLLASLGDYPLRTPLFAAVFIVAVTWLHGYDRVSKPADRLHAEG